ncbi:histidine kinase [Dactylosporangium sp. NPDC049140]|uniref:sensor histidine kinase n=1 Tax=Dactylosporangium sp. NPDC049140 TaxID=3155647 RepID=UPI0033FE3C10
MNMIVGFWRACALAAVTLLVPAVWAGAVVVAYLWRGSPWSWFAPASWAVAGTLLLVRPVCHLVRALVARWTGTVIPAGYREPGPVTRLSTGYWWNGYSYESSRRRAEQDQRIRNRMTDPALRRDLRFVLVAPFAAGIVAAVPPVALGLAVLGGWWLLGVPVALAAAPFAWRVGAPVAVRFMRPSPAMRLAERVEELTAQRADTTVAQAAEIRRIERDLHDGAQARLVALGLSLATAEKLMATDPDRAAAVLREARAGAATSLSELRELVRGISPPVLNERGLIDAVRAFAMDSPLETTVETDLRLRLDPPIESALYFGVAELLTNAVKHARASRARIAIGRDGTHLVVDVCDDGRGGATVPAEGGLAGLRRRLAAFDGTLELTSPDGGPTRARMAVPCESS